MNPMVPLVLPFSVLRVLCILLLQAAPLRAQHNSYDNPVCTDSLSVTRGQQTIMSCNISNPLRGVSISLRVPGRDTQSLFKDKAPGMFSEAGWQLWIEGGLAQLVIEEAWGSHAGRYIWLLCGRQRTIQTTSLNLSESPDLSPTWSETQRTPLTTDTSLSPVTAESLNKAPSYLSCLLHLLIPTVLVLSFII